MYFRLSILLIFLFISGIVDSKHRKDESPFIKNLTNNQRSSFFGIAKNKDISFQEKENKLVKWAEANNLTEQYAEFSKNLTLHKEQVSKNISDIIDRLATAKSEVDKVNADWTLTQNERNQKIDELKKTYPNEIPTLFYIGGLIENSGKNRTRNVHSDGKRQKRQHQ